MDPIIIWIILTAVLLCGLMIWRGLNSPEGLRLTNSRWKAALVLAAVIALLPTIFLKYHFAKEVDIPPGVAEELEMPVTSINGSR